MSSQRPARSTQQDIIAKVRYSNQLPPPPLPPKLLDIPGTGLAGGQYTSAAYASRLAREQPLNIEADAELGMPIDLVGIPGVFAGDYKAISIQPGPRTIHPKDKALLRPLNALGKSASASEQVSFLRRTEYAASSMPQMFASGTSKDLLRLRNDPRRKQKNLDKEDPHNILRHIIKGFDIAYPQDAVTGQEQESTASLRGAEVTADEVKAWTKPVHPSKPELTLLDSYPVLPDMDAIPQTGFYMVVKFTTNPTIATDRYDTRFDAAMFQPLMDTERHEIFKQKMEEWDPESGKPKPLLDFDYAYYLPEDETSVRGIKRKFNVNDPEKDDPELYTDDLADGQRAFKYARLRTYETYHQSGDPEVFYNDAVALALHDPELEVGAVPGAQKRLTKGAYFYPIAQRAVLRPKRKAAYSQMNGAAENDAPDELNVTVRELESELEGIREHQVKFDPSVQVEAAA